MKLLNILARFRNDEAGAVTVDWVVLTAGIVGLGLVVMGTVGGAVDTAADDLKTSIESASTAAAGTP